MKVRCARLTNPHTRETEIENSWLTLGRHNLVLCIEFDRQAGLHFRLIGDDGKTPALHEASQFEVVNGRIPPNWIVASDSDGVFELIPKRWTAQGFWERYFEREETAVKIFQEDVEIIVAADR